jgi:hypothetical protein
VGNFYNYYQEIMVPARIKNNYVILAFVSVCFSLVWWHCAGQVPPDGGPRDLTPPTVVGVYPEPNSTNVETDIIRFQFSKYVDRQSFQRALFISPLIEDMEIHWRGRIVDLNILEPLRDNTTYSITVGTDLRDTREGTRLSDAFTLAFSTGDEIDRGEINGKVYADDPVGVLVFAYQLHHEDTADTLNPSEQGPDYITQTGDDGSFRLPYLRLGTYRIIALKDEFQNRLYDRDVDAYGVFVHDPLISEDEPAYDGVTVRMHKPDFTKPFISRVTAIHNSKISIRFSKQLDPGSVSKESFHVRHTETDRSLDITDYSIRLENPAEVYLFTGVQESGRYLLRVDSTVADLFGNTLRPDGLEEQFDGKSEGPDTPVTIEYIKPRSGQRDIHPEEAVMLQFSYPVKSESVERALSVIDTNEVALEGDYKWDDMTTVTFIPHRLLESKMPYTVVVELDSLPAKNGLHYEDSLYTSNFTVMDRDLLGAIEGELLTGLDSLFTIRFEKFTSARDGERYSVTRRGGGPFTMHNIPEGQYTLWVFSDPERSGDYDHGEVFPFRGSAPFVTYPDTVRVRARWTVDGILLDMRRFDEVDITETAVIGEE